MSGFDFDRFGSIHPRPSGDFVDKGFGMSEGFPHSPCGRAKTTVSSDNLQNIRHACLSPPTRGHLREERRPRATLLFWPPRPRGPATVSERTGFWQPFSQPPAVCTTGGGSLSGSSGPEGGAA